MKVTDLIALRDFTTVESHGVIRGIAGQPVGPVMYSTAERLVKMKLARRKRTKKDVGDKQWQQQDQDRSQ
jgi:hypothetical protein